MVSQGGGYSTDFYIRNEGFAVIIAISIQSKIAAFNAGFENKLLEIGHEIKGQPVWVPGMKHGLYKFHMRRSQLPGFKKWLYEHQLSVESEI